MSETKERYLPYGKAIGDFLGIVKCLLIITDVKSFKKWINEFHFTEAGRNHLPGYKLLFSTLFRMLITGLERNTSLGLTSDAAFDRASFKGISIDKLPNTCEKVILVKNLRSYFNNVMDSNNWAGLEAAVHKLSDEALDSFSNIKQVSIINSDYPISNVETAVNYSAIFQTYIFLNDTSRGIPHGYLSAMIDNEEAAFGYQHRMAQTLGNTFFGYKYGVQYIWSQLLKEKFKNSVVSNIHETTDWNSFDKYFDKVKSRIINPLEESTGGVIGYDYFVLIDRSPRSYFEKLLREETPAMPPSAEERIQRIFLWYPIQLVDSSDYSFSGVPAFIPLLMGLIQIKRRRSTDKSKAKVVRIIHGGDEEHRRSYSYAILVELSGHISDSSGWLLFYDCCDDRGATSGWFQAVETLLHRYTENNFIEIASLRIEKQALLEFSRKHS